MPTAYFYKIGSKQELRKEDIYISSSGIIHPTFHFTSRKNFYYDEDFHSEPCVFDDVVVFI